VGGAVIGGGNVVHLKKLPKGYRVGNNAYAWRVSYVGQRTPTKQSRPRKKFEEFKPANSQIETHMTASRHEQPLDALSFFKLISVGIAANARPPILPRGQVALTCDTDADRMHPSQIHPHNECGSTYQFEIFTP
jgi:hypothetical protein